MEDSARLTASHDAPAPTTATRSENASNPTSPNSAASSARAGAAAGAGGGVARSHSMKQPQLQQRAASQTQQPNPDDPDAVTSQLRRSHTLSTSASSQLVRTERNRARLALGRGGLSEEDQRYYVPESPVRPESNYRWPDAGGAAGAGAGPEAPTNSIGSGQRYSASPTKTDARPFSTSTSTSPASPAPKSGSSSSSSFVVVSAAKGDSAMEERRTRAASESNVQSQRPVLEARNSLKPFLEAEGETWGQEEEWERRLQDERVKEAMDLQSYDAESEGQRRTSPPSSSYSTRDSPYRASRPGYLAHSQQRSYGSIGSASDLDAWGSNDGSQPNSSNNIRGGAPTPLNPSYNERSTTPNSSATLSHSNSLSSHHSQSHISSSNNAPAPISPVGGFSRSPWSPTDAETKRFERGISSSGPSRTGTNPSPEEIQSLGESFGSLEMLESHDTVEPTLKTVVESRPTESPVKPFGRPVLRADTSNLPRAVAGKLNGPATAAPGRRLPPLLTNPEVLASLGEGSQDGGAGKGTRGPPSFLSRQGPASAAAYVPPIGHSHKHLTSSTPRHEFSAANAMPSITEPSQQGSFTAAPGPGGSDWIRQKELIIGSPTSGGGAEGASGNESGSSGNNSASHRAGGPFSTAVGVNPLAESWPNGTGFEVGLAMQQQQQIQMLQAQMQQTMHIMDLMKGQATINPSTSLPPLTPGFPLHSLPPLPPMGMGIRAFSPPAPFVPGLPNPNLGAMGPAMLGQEHRGAPSNGIDPSIASLIASKGYNPPYFDLRPVNARFFVIKSYTEEDVHKSLKHEIWASTDLGNKRLDRAFRENSTKGPVYLFFSVNGSGHFCGLAEMLTSVDYTTSSPVWASDKWKGIFKLRWIYVKDVPLASLRHIRLSNTPENKPVTSSRDTQEVPYDAGCEVLRILSTYQSRTSLLQDFQWYESLEGTKGVAIDIATPSAPGESSASPTPSSIPPSNSATVAPIDVAPPIPQYQPQRQNHYPNPQGNRAAPPGSQYPNHPPQPHHQYQQQQQQPYQQQQFRPMNGQLNQNHSNSGRGRPAVTLVPRSAPSNRGMVAAAPVGTGGSDV